MQLLYLAEDDVKQCLTIREAIDLAERGITADGAARSPAKSLHAHRRAGFIKPFSGYLAGEDYAYVKTFSFYEGNRARDLPVTDSMVLLFDAATGLPVCIMEANHVTALKTGASTAVTARRLARPRARSRPSSVRAGWDACTAWRWPRRSRWTRCAWSTCGLRRRTRSRCR